MTHITSLLMKPKHLLPHGGAGDLRSILTENMAAHPPRVGALAVMVAVTALCPAISSLWAQESSEIAQASSESHRELDFRAD